MNNRSANDGPAFFSSLAVQRRVIFALLMREVLTRFGRHNIGFLWLFVEPMIFTLGVTALWTATQSVHGSNLGSSSIRLSLNRESNRIIFGNRIQIYTGTESASVQESKRAGLDNRFRTQI